ncbi:hypothetical protein Lalb_Chr24g0393841 [Lupinus albus]|uniref:Uncharacterized protein n=1 Tax=Lupinus albus TaxID=3870 RepID=A0A6A4NEH4_LUPAL|nr:hypothetical protein Lalb_Chr24g0393841 [Lupinus albus]
MSFVFWFIHSTCLLPGFGIEYHIQKAPFSIVHCQLVLVHCQLVLVHCQLVLVISINGCTVSLPFMFKAPFSPFNWLSATSGAIIQDDSTFICVT